jgi:hypothetical protein
VPPLPPALASGFSEADCDALGHWLRDQGAKEQASASAAARAAFGPDARQAAARALAVGKPSSRGRMRVYYGGAGASANRFSERVLQLDVRQRLVHTVRHLLRGRDWRSLPRGQLDLRILRHASPTDASE